MPFYSSRFRTLSYRRISKAVKGAPAFEILRYDNYPTIVP
jgi:hypothetical protein